MRKRGICVVFAIIIAVFGLKEGVNGEFSKKTGVLESPTKKIVVQPTAAPKKKTPITVVSRGVKRIFVFMEKNGEIVDSGVSPEQAAKAIDDYMSSIEAPLGGYGMVFVRVASERKQDWRLLPAIAVRESSGGKHLFRRFNPFGWGQLSFRSFADAIETVSKNFAGDNYKSKNIRQKLRKYNSVVKEYPAEVMKIMRDIEKRA